ncbi:MAG TPA: SDR family oxidoreductase [Solirubrobacteraceae bacterium]|jgi:NAD(P)-dependent dehydrogenase (short-subunit alcohol dehydrogenase family)
MAKQPRSLSGKVAVVTGGARGIGRATAQALVRQGARVAIGDLDPAIAQATADELGGGTIALPLDVTDRPGFTAFLDEVEQRLGPLDVLVNNAGIMPLGPFDEEDDAVVIRQIEINLHAVIHGTKEAMRRMRPRGTGHIVNVASTAGKSGFAGAATYCACKHGVVGLSESVRAELRGSGVDVSVVMPGLVRTELTAGLGEARGVKSVTPEQVAEHIVEALQTNRFDVYVPRSIGPIVAFFGVLPRRAREAAGRLLKSDQVLTHVDERARAAYEARAAASAPAAEVVIEDSSADRERSAV